MGRRADASRQLLVNFWVLGAYSVDAAKEEGPVTRDFAGGASFEMQVLPALAVGEAPDQ